MNCFETRSEFANFWRGALQAERRREFLGHLKGCSKCDAAFRAFALTAPMLYPAQTAAATGGSSTVMDLGEEPRISPSRTEEILRRASVYRLRPRSRARNWGAVASAVSSVAAAILIAYFSVATPTQTLDDALSAAVPVAAQSGSDFLGQQMPELPPNNGDLAG
jgi:anti-sigma factor RsiW